MTIKYVFSDIDGTLTGSDHILSLENKEAIKKIRDMGIGFCLQTGRLPCALQEMLEDLDVDKQDDFYFISSNGALIANTNSFIIKQHYLSKNNLNLCLDYFSTFKNVSYCLVSYDNYFFVGDDSFSTKNRYASKFNKIIDYEEAKRLIETTNIYKFLFLDKDLDEMSKVRTYINEKTNGELVSFNSSKYALEIVSGDISKGGALLEFCEYMNIDPNDCLVIGDNYNDESMFKVAGHKACPNNAVDDIKKQCEYVSKYDASNSAVADILNKLIIEG